MIGAKEGVVEAITTLVGTSITNSLIQTSGGDFKSVEDYTLHNVFQSAFENADHPPVAEVLEQLIKVLHYTFNFRKKIRANREIVQNMANKMSAYRINVGTPAIALMLLANIKTATKHKYGREFWWQCRAFEARTRTTTNTMTCL